MKKKLMMSLMVLGLGSALFGEEPKGGETPEPTTCQGPQCPKPEQPTCPDGDCGK